jgi:hypothetical protein
VEKLGEGGMGEVWVAKQTEPVKRKVALKVIKTGMDSKAVLVADKARPARNAIGVWDARTGKIQSVLAEPGESYDCFAFSPNGHRLWAVRGNSFWRSLAMKPPPIEITVWDATPRPEK